MTLPIPLLFEFWKAGELCLTCGGSKLIQGPEIDGVEECPDCEALEKHIKEHHPDLWEKHFSGTPRGGDQPIPF